MSGDTERLEPGVDRTVRPFCDSRPGRKERETDCRGHAQWTIRLITLTRPTAGSERRPCRCE